MALYVAKILNISPLEIMNTWYENQLVTTFGYYKNQDTMEYYQSIPKNERGSKKDYEFYFIDEYKYSIKEKLQEILDGSS